jgi:vitamin B12 transporter
VGAVYQTSESVSVKASYGTGFRAPSLNELFYPFYGDPNLKPEESKSWEVGIEQKVSDGSSLTITYFEQKYENLIQTDPLTFTAKNIAEAEIKGVEVSAEAKEKSGSGIRAGYTYLDTEDKSTGKRLPFRAKNKAVVSLFLVEGGSTLTLEYNYVGGRFDNLASRDLKPYNLVNLGLTMGLSKSFSLYARIDNLFNREYEEAANYGTYKRSYYAGLKASF